MQEREESVEEFVRWNLGDEIFERLVEPFCSGTIQTSFLFCCQVLIVIWRWMKIDLGNETTSTAQSPPGVHKSSYDLTRSLTVHLEEWSVWLLICRGVCWGPCKAKYESCIWQGLAIGGHWWQHHWGHNQASPGKEEESSTCTRPVSFWYQLKLQSHSTAQLLNCCVPYRHWGTDVCFFCESSRFPSWYWCVMIMGSTERCQNLRARLLGVSKRD